MRVNMEKKYIAIIELIDGSILKLEKEDLLELAKLVDEVKNKDTTTIKLQRVKKQ